MKQNDLDYQETMFCWSPKLQKTIRLVGLEIVLSEIAESRPEIEEYAFPGPKLFLDDQFNKTEHTVRMTVKWRDGVTGAIEYLSEKQVKSGLSERLANHAKDIGLRIDIYDRRHLSKEDKKYSAWRQLVRYLHPMHVPQELGITRMLQWDEWPLERLSIEDICKSSKVNRQIVLIATAYLIHLGLLTFDADRGAFDHRTKVWRIKQ